MRVTNEFGLVAAAVDIVDLGGRDDIETRILAGRVQGAIITLLERYALQTGFLLVILIKIRHLFSIIDVTGLLIAVHRVRCQEAAEIQLTDTDRLTAALLDGDSDGTIDGTTGVVSAEHTLQRRAVGNSQIDIIINVGILRTTEHLLDTMGTVCHHVNLTVAIGILSTSVGPTY